MYLAARVAYFFEYRVDPGTQLVLHECNTTNCVNHDHLFLGSQSDNMRHMVAEGRKARGYWTPNAKLDECDIPDIRRRLDAGESMNSIARAYDVNSGTIHGIATGRTWGYVTNSPE